MRAVWCSRTTCEDISIIKTHTCDTVASQIEENLESSQNEPSSPKSSWWSVLLINTDYWLIRAREPGTETIRNQGSRALTIQQTCRCSSSVSKPIAEKNSFCSILSRSGGVAPVCTVSQVFVFAFLLCALEGMCCKKSYLCTAFFFGVTVSGRFFQAFFPLGIQSRAPLLTQTPQMFVSCLIHLDVFCKNIYKRWKKYFRILAKTIWIVAKIGYDHSHRTL